MYIYADIYYMLLSNTKGYHKKQCQLSFHTFIGRVFLEKYMLKLNLLLMKSTGVLWGGENNTYSVEYTCNSFK